MKLKRKMKISIGNLIDQISIENIRIWMAEDIKRKPRVPDSEIADACRITNIANSKRNNLIQAIDEYFGIESGQGSTKLYGR